jgi:hypothetical protein
MIMVGLFTTEFGSLVYSDTKFMHFMCYAKRPPSILCIFYHWLYYTWSRTKWNILEV